MQQMYNIYLYIYGLQIYLFSTFTVVKKRKLYIRGRFFFYYINIITELIKFGFKCEIEMREREEKREKGKNNTHYDDYFIMI